MLDRVALEQEIRSRATAVYVGKNTVLCRIIGRYKFYQASDDVGFGAHIIIDGIWEPWVTSFIARTVKPGMFVIDVGANHGYFTLLMADLVAGRGRVAAVEPNPRTLALLYRNVDINGFGARVTVLGCALSATSAESLNLFTPPNEPKNARLIDGTERSDNVVSVRGARLDDLFGDWPQVDYIKIDVEGAEEAVVQGGWSVLRRFRPRLLLEYKESRCSNPRSFLEGLIALYGTFYVLGFDGELSPGSLEEVLNADYDDDWMLYFEEQAFA